MKKFLFTILLSIFFLSTVWAYAPLTRIRNFVNDKNNGIPITSSYMDAEFNQILAAANLTGVVQGNAPSSPTNGSLWFDSTNNVWKTLRNNEWVQLNVIQYGNVMSFPQNGDIWIKSSTGQSQPMIWEPSGINWNDIPVAPGLTGVNWQMPVFGGTNWESLTINTGINWNSINPILFNGVNWDDPSYFPGANEFWQYQSFGKTPIWSTNNTHGSQFFSTSGTFTSPSGVTKIYLTMVGGGGGGASGTSGGGGGAGAYCVKYYFTVSANTGYTVTINSGGTVGNSGGSVIFSTVTINGGSPGSGSTGGAGGISGFASGNPGISGSAGQNNTTNTAGGSSLFGTAGYGQASGSGNASGYGAGGGGAGGSGTGGSGAPGMVLVEW